MPKPELQTVLSNIGSLVEEAKMMSGNEPMEDEPVEEPEEEIKPELAKSILKWLKAEEEGEDDDDKDEVGKSDEGPNASDKAEEIVDGGQGEVNEKNVNEVAKAIVRSLLGMKKNAVEKTQEKSKDSELKKAMDAVLQDNAQIKQALSHLLEGMGIVSQIKDNSKLEKAQDSREIPNNSDEIKKTMDFIKSSLGIKDESSTAPVATGRQSLRKSLTEDGGKALSAIFAINAKNTLKK